MNGTKPWLVTVAGGALAILTASAVIGTWTLNGSMSMVVTEIKGLRSDVNDLKSRVLYVERSNSGRGLY